MLHPILYRRLPPHTFSILAALLAAIGYGTIPVFAKLYYESGANLATFLFVRVIISFLIFMPLISIIQKKSFLPPKQHMKDIMIWCVLILGVYVTYFNAITYIDVSLVVILFFSYPLFTLLIEAALKTETVSKNQILGALICFIGLIFVIGPKISAINSLGIGLSVAAAIIMSLNLVAEKDLTRKLTPNILLTSVGLFLTIPLGLYVLIAGWQAGSWKIMAIICVITVLTDICLQFALKNIGAVKSSNLMNMEPVIAIFAAFLLAGEVLSFWQYIGSAIVVLSLYLMHKKARYEY